MDHKPVLLKEVIEYLDPKPNQNFIDCTFGGGGHSREILNCVGKGGKLLGIDADKNNLDNFQNKDRLILINDNFRNLKSIYANNFPYAISGILLDLGISSMELDDQERGFSFLKDGPLDMRFDQGKQGTTAEAILNQDTLENLIKIFTEYGEAPRGKAWQVAKLVVAGRRKNPFRTTFDFLQVVLQAFYPGAVERGEITTATRDFYHHRRKITHPATQFFQALRIEVNDELGSLREVLPVAVEILAKGGRLAVISFHSLEDRIVKNFFRDLAKEGQLKILTKKPIAPGEAEIKDNPRSRSAKMRVAEKIQA